MIPLLITTQPMIPPRPKSGSPDTEQDRGRRPPRARRSRRCGPGLPAHASSGAGTREEKRCVRDRATTRHQIGGWLPQAARRATVFRRVIPAGTARTYRPRLQVAFRPRPPAASGTRRVPAHLRRHPADPAAREAHRDGSRPACKAPFFAPRRAASRAALPSRPSTRRGTTAIAGRAWDRLPRTHRGPQDAGPRLGTPPAAVRRAPLTAGQAGMRRASHAAGSGPGWCAATGPQVGTAGPVTPRGRGPRVRIALPAASPSR